MKKIMILAAVAIAAVACSRTYDIAPASDQAIGFSSWTGYLTKAISDPRVAGTNTFGVGDSFAVYGYKEASSTKTTVFDDVAVEMTAAGNPGTWTYSPLRYWDRNADQYVFFAISPSAIGTAATVAPQTGEITSASITFAGNNNDILVADKETVANAAFGTQVVLDFNHIASLVDFKVAKAPNLHDATVTVTAFTLANIKATGTFGVSDAYNATVYGGTNGPVVTWNSTATASYVPANGVTSVTLPQVIAEDDAFPVPAEPADGKSTMLINNLVVMPQVFTAPADPAVTTDANAQKLTITYTIEVTGGGTNEYTSTLWLSDFDIVNDTDQTDTKVASWETGKHYTFYITLDSTPIVFGATVNDWTTGTGYHYLLN
jgi:hypothetical protein